MNELKNNEIMVKTIFVGKINDREFDNIRDYNLALTEAQKNGGNFTASLEVKTINEEDKCECKQNECKCKQNEKKQAYYILPGFVKGAINSIYMDEYYTEDDYKKMMDEALNNIEIMSKQQLQTYAKKVDAILDKLEEDDDKNENAKSLLNNNIEAHEQQIDRLCDELDKMNGKYELLEAVEATIQEYGEFYNTLANYIEDKISVDEKDEYDNARDKERCECECECECKCVEEQKEFNLGDFLSKENVDDILNTITTEWNKIFNKYSK